MNQLPDYLLKLSLGLTLIWLFYYLVLRRLTFYHWNRWYLLLYSALAFIIPLVDLNQTLPPRQLAEIPILRSVPTVSAATNVGTQFFAPEGEKKQPAAAKITPPESNREPLSPAKIIIGLLTLGTAFMLLRLGLQLFSYFRIKKRAQLVSEGEGVKVYHVARNIVPFSFGNAIFLNPDLHAANDLKEILCHELVHVRQRHTFDVLGAELLCALNWFNPFAWLIRHAIRQNLEFIADREVLEKGIEARTYQLLLLKVAGVPEFRLANRFNFSSLKQRIIMMNRLKSARVHLLRFLFVLPLLFILLMACRTETEIENRPVESQDLIPSKSRQVDFEYLAGMLIDAESGSPIVNLKLEKIVGKMEQVGTTWYREPIETLGTISTDENGFYFWKIDVRNQTRENVVYELKPKDEEYKHLNISVIHGREWFTSANLRYSIKFLIEGENRGLQDDYAILRRDFAEPGSDAPDESEVKQLLLKELPGFASQHRLIYDFKKRYWKPTQIITKFRNGYFDKDRSLLGYEGVLEFYLDGKKIGYEEINQEFRGYLIKPAKREYDEAGTRRGINNKLFYLTFPVYRKPPPEALLTNQNIEWIDTKDFDLALLNKEPYMLDGFRQVFGASSNLMPLKEEVKRVAIFKGDLARYYDRKLDKLWWVETRPVEEVMERPNFVAR